MAWWINVVLGFIIGSFAATYSEGYRNTFKGILGALSKKTEKKKTKTNKKK